MKSINPIAEFVVSVRCVVVGLCWSSRETIWTVVCTGDVYQFEMEGED
jgi:hypothetical protein